MKKHVLALSLMAILGTFATACTDKKQASTSDAQAENKQHDHADAEHAAEHDHADHEHGDAHKDGDHHEHDDHADHEHEKVAHIGPHVHGEAVLKVALSGKDLVIDLDTPSMNVFGFEHEPSTDEQKATVAKNEKQLNDAVALFNITGGDCDLKKADVDMPFDADHAHEAHEHEEHAHEDEHEHGEHEHGDEAVHSDVEATYTFECQSPEKITDIQVNVFNQFSGFEKLNVEWVAGDKQGSQILTKSSQKLLLK